MRTDLGGTQIEFRVGVEGLEFDPVDTHLCSQVDVRSWDVHRFDDETYTAKFDCTGREIHLPTSSSVSPRVP